MYPKNERNGKMRSILRRSHKKEFSSMHPHLKKAKGVYNIKPPSCTSFVSMHFQLNGDFSGDFFE